MKYRALEAATFGPGARLILTKEQAAPRQHVLKHISDSLYETTAVVQFKAGEEFGVVGEPTKALQALLNSPTKAEKSAKAAKPTEKAAD